MGMEEIKLTQFSPGAGCGCKISPKNLQEILKQSGENNPVPALLVGNETSDDAAVYDTGDGKCIISTTDFFMPITDDPYDFGRIASANAISDVYAMGGTPLMAISILGWPLKKLPAELAARVLQGSRAICKQAGIPLAGGHSIDSLEPIFGLAVTGMVEKDRIRRNSDARAGNLLFLTKPLGIGLLSTAEKKGVLLPDHKNVARDLMIRLNSIGRELSGLPAVTAMTDVTGFGLLGHLNEMCEGANLQARIYLENIPVIEDWKEYVQLGAIPGGTQRNFDSYGHKIQGLDELHRNILCDPQTSGGLLIAVDADDTADFFRLMDKYEFSHKPIGRMEEVAGASTAIIIEH